MSIIIHFVKISNLLIITNISVDGNWGEWGEWGHVSTDSGVRERTRVCDSDSGGAHCQGGLAASSESQKGEDFYIRGHIIGSMVKSIIYSLKFNKLLF